MFGLDYGCGWCKEFPGTEEDNNKRTQVSGDLSKQRPTAAPPPHIVSTLLNMTSTTDIVIVMEIVKED